jgi:hypothetical protein
MAAGLGVEAHRELVSPCTVRVVLTVSSYPTGLPSRLKLQEVVGVIRR